MEQVSIIERVQPTSGERLKTNSDKFRQFWAMAASKRESTCRESPFDACQSSTAHLALISTGSSQSTVEFTSKSTNKLTVRPHLQTNQSAVLKMSDDSGIWMRPVRRCRRRLLYTDEQVNCNQNATTVTPENRNIPFYLDGLVCALRRMRRQIPLELNPVNLIKQFWNKLLGSDELFLTPRREPCQQPPDSPDLVPVDVMGNFLNCGTF